MLKISFGELYQQASPEAVELLQAMLAADHMDFAIGTAGLCMLILPQKFVRWMTQEKISQK